MVTFSNSYQVALSHKIVLFSPCKCTLDLQNDAVSNEWEASEITCKWEKMLFIINWASYYLFVYIKMFLLVCYQLTLRNLVMPFNQIFKLTRLTFSSFFFLHFEATCKTGYGRINIIDGDDIQDSWFPLCNQFPMLPLWYMYFFLFTWFIF